MQPRVVLFFLLFTFSAFGIGLISAKPSCLECKATFAAVIPLLGANATQEELLQVLESECAKAPSEFQPVCDEIAQWAVSELPDLEKTFELYEPVGICSILSLCKVDCCKSRVNPEQIHLSFSGSTPTAMTVTWVARNNEDGWEVQYGLNKGGPYPNSGKLSATPRTYTKGGWEGYIFQAEMTDLKAPDVRYYYRVVNTATGATSNEFTFQTGPGVGIQEVTRSTRVGFIADMGLSESSETVAQLTNIVEQGETDFMIHAGDISYADAYQKWWDDFMNYVEPIAANNAYMTCPGNHELPWKFLAYKERFSMPYQASNSTNRMYYSFDYGAVHYIGVNTELWVDEGWVGDAQLAWLEADLQKANANRANVPWIVFYSHRPLYCVQHGFDCHENAAMLRYRLEDVFYKYQVDLAMAGHLHVYETTWPVYKGKPNKTFNNPGMTTYVVCGAAGNREGLVGSYTQTDYMRSHIVTHGYGLVIANATSLEWQFIANDQPDSPSDSFTLTK